MRTIGKPNLEIIGNRYGRLTVVEFVPKKGFKCLCDCGATTYGQSYNLRKGKKESCGCKIGKWKAEEDQFMIDNAGKMTFEQMSKHLGRTRIAVRNRSEYLRDTGKVDNFYLLGENNPTAKHSNEDVRLAKLLIEDGTPAAQVSEIMEMPVSYVRELTQNRTRISK